MLAQVAVHPDVPDLHDSARHRAGFERICSREKVLRPFAVLNGVWMRALSRRRWACRTLWSGVSANKFGHWW
ncbi:Unknown protein sequence [Pseudomonas syringae pv. cilantro]|uniref:Uncharacterized protein n=2 Tax=Pseudomonas syringae group TaxID=136849 RepID=A0A0N0GFW3_PSESX|nr:Unknown protein sequence [Pseudomonas syringae pv. cilantro]KPW76144.1 hypothetical protein ALO76_102434 [Pseudomonas syringae pv. coriandricola]RMN08625.1 hypothetical protein ALQ65_102270 [Pseudomonas syringae pv. coriandricola]